MSSTDGSVESLIVSEQIILGPSDIIKTLTYFQLNFRIPNFRFSCTFFFLSFLNRNVHRDYYVPFLPLYVECVGMDIFSL